jgi:3-phenylpropionate/cinnamic acid dioxygenase small subunit
MPGASSGFPLRGNDDAARTDGALADGDRVKTKRARAAGTSPAGPALVPRRESHRELTPLGDLAILEEDKRYLEMRVARLDTGMAWAEDPPSRTRHLIGNLEAAPLENGEVQAKTAFLVYRSHLETDHQLLSGCREDVLRKVKGAWKVARRTIVLDANVLLDKNLSVFL